MIPVLHNNGYVENAFGLLSNDGDNTLIVDSKLSIVIEYRNLYGHRYTQNQTLIMKPMDNFAGSIWKKGN